MKNCVHSTEKWMDGFLLYVLFNSIYFSYIRTVRFDLKNGCVLCYETPFTVEEFSPRAGLELGTTRSVCHRFTH